MEHLLIIEDDAALAAMLAEYLGKAGYATTIAGTATEGVPGVSKSVRGDERLLRRMLRNLLANARQYAGDSSVEVDVRPLDGQRARIAVADRGPGVPPQLRERIFEPFYRLPGPAQSASGAGLGLSLVRQIARRHGGEVVCRERDGGGSVFEVILPYGPPNA
ncbi:MAG TPA: HAMP domain-containing sensor histidine kinase [Burkholderiales bacterium]|nr:HAMP domain-containing sensor histidine kinase [Burkholderiales bacterium]